MRTTLLMTVASVIAMSASSARADPAADGLIDSLPCNALCRHWLGLGSTPEPKIGPATDLHPDAGTTATLAEPAAPVARAVPTQRPAVPDARKVTLAQRPIPRPVPRPRALAAAAVVPPPVSKPQVVAPAVVAPAAVAVLAAPMVVPAEPTSSLPSAAPREVVAAPRLPEAPTPVASPAAPIPAPADVEAPRRTAALPSVVEAPVAPPAVQPEAILAALDLPPAPPLPVIAASPDRVAAADAPPSPSVPVTVDSRAPSEVRAAPVALPPALDVIAALLLAPPR